MKNKAVFLDRDGTLIHERGHISSIKQVKFIRGAYQALRTLQNLGFRIVIVSNQSGVARGIITRKQVEEANRYILSVLQQRGLTIDKILYCPHHPSQASSGYKNKCRCRKPSTGLVKDAQKSLNLSLRNSYVIGDKLSDIELAKNIKGTGILVLTGYGKTELSKSRSNSVKPHLVAKNLSEAVKKIAGELRLSGKNDTNRF